MRPLATYRMRREHRWAHAHLSEYIDGELDPTERRRLRRHTDDCEECGPLLRALTVLIPELRRLRRQPWRSIAPSVIERLHDEASLAANAGERQ